MSTVVESTANQVLILICPWELRGMLAEIGNKHETVELVRTVEPGDSYASTFWSYYPSPQSIVLWIRINGRFCPRVVEGQILQHEQITEYFARREHLLRQEHERKYEGRKRDSREGDFEGSGPDLDD